MALGNLERKKIMYKQYIKEYKNFPIDGINYLDLNPIYQDGQLRTRLVRGGSGHGTSMSMCAHCFDLNDDEVWLQMTRHLINRVISK